MYLLFLKIFLTYYIPKLIKKIIILIQTYFRQKNKKLFRFKFYHLKGVKINILHHK